MNKKIDPGLKLEMVNRIMDSIEHYADKHNLAVECGAEYIFQNDKAQVDALNLTGDIFNIISEYYSSDEEEEE